MSGVSFGFGKLVDAGTYVGCCSSLFCVDAVSSGFLMVCRVAGAVGVDVVDGKMSGDVVSVAVGGGRGFGGLMSFFTLNHVSPVHAGPGNGLFVCPCCRSCSCSSKSSVEPSALRAIVLQ